MTIHQINRMSARRKYLTKKELRKLEQGIVNNKEAREIAIRGAIALEDFDLVLYLSLKK